MLHRRKLFGQLVHRVESPESAAVITDERKRRWRISHANRFTNAKRSKLAFYLGSSKL
jgi:hypothetical protein